MYESNQFLPRKELSQRIKWLINLRWIASFGLCIVVTVSKYLLQISLPLLPLYTGNAALIFYNIFFFVYYKRLTLQQNESLWFRKINHMVNLQISLDLMLLLFLIHFSGGFENPFISFFIFHMVIASILLSKKAAYLQATLIIIFFGLIMGGESLGLFRHYNLSGLIVASRFQNFRHFIVVFFTLILTLYITVYISTTIIQKLRERENDLALANKKLEEQDRIKSLYVYTLSHDIKGSIGAIQSCLKVVLSGLTGSISKKSREMVARAEHRSMDLLHFINDLLELSEIRAAREIKMEKFTISDAVKKVISQHKTPIEEKGLAIVVEIPISDIYVNAHQALIEELLLNLITNAVKYTPPGGKINLSCTELKARSLIEISVADTGIGIPEEDLPHIFEDFYRAKNAKVFSEDGTGLGLSIVKQIVDVHGGTLRVESTKDKGSSFILTLPSAVSGQEKIF